MLALNHLKGSTYYIKTASTNVGLYKLNNKECVLLDGCLLGKSTEALIATLDAHQLTPKLIFITHGHIDHFGCCHALKERYGTKIVVSDIESAFIDYPILNNLSVFPFVPFSDYNFQMPTSTSVDFILAEDSFTYGDHTFNKILLPGHSFNHCGFDTPDQVLFAGDAFLGIDTLKKTKFYYNYDVLAVLDTIEHLFESDYAYYIPSHGEAIFDIRPTLEENLKYFNNHFNQLLELLKERPLSTDAIMGYMVGYYKVSHVSISYELAKVCIGSMLSYLENTNQIKIVYIDHILKFQLMEKSSSI